MWRCWGLKMITGRTLFQWLISILTFYFKSISSVIERHFYSESTKCVHSLVITIFWFKPTIALCNKSNGRCDIKAEKREELESKSSHKSDIWPPAASKKWGEIYWKYIFQTLEAIFPYKGVFVTKVVKANIIAFIKTKILRPVLSVTNPPFQKCQPLLHSALMVLLK